MALSSAQVGRLLYDEHAAGTRFHTLGPEAALVDLPAAYAAQRELVALLHPELGKTAGYKIGLTSARMQKFCNIDQPIAGVVLANRMAASGVALDGKDYGRVGLEFEVGVRLGRDLPPSGAPYDSESIAKAVDAVCAAVEVVDDRHADYKSLDVRSLVADNSWNAGAILGDFKKNWPDLAAASGTIMLDGAEVDRGHGRDVLGHPFIPLAWLANHLAAGGQGLRAGEVVLTGSLVTTRFPQKSESYRYELAGVGSVALTVTI